jgi:DNA-binding transcriptional LysR family regulator
MDETKAFVAVVQHGGFGRGARELGLPKSTVSRKIANLEERLGVTLLKRTTRVFQLTEAGRAYFETAHRILEELATAEQRVKLSQKAITGLIRFTAPTDLGASVLPRLLMEFQNRYPDIEIDLDLTDRVVDLVTERFDVALRAGSLADSSLRARKLGTGVFQLYASPKYLRKHGPPKHPSELKNLRCLHYNPGDHDRLWSLTNGSSHYRFKVPGEGSINSLSCIRTLAALGGGVALLPTFLCKEALQEGELVQVLPSWSSERTGFYLVHPQQSFVPQRLRVFLDFFAEKLEDKI